MTQRITKKQCEPHAVLQEKDRKRKAAMLQRLA